MGGMQRSTDCSLAEQTTSAEGTIRGERNVIARRRNARPTSVLAGQKDCPAQSAVGVKTAPTMNRPVQKWNLWMMKAELTMIPTTNCECGCHTAFAVVIYYTVVFRLVSM